MFIKKKQNDRYRNRIRDYDGNMLAALPTELECFTFDSLRTITCSAIKRIVLNYVAQKPREVYGIYDTTCSKYENVLFCVRLQYTCLLFVLIRVSLHEKVLPHGGNTRRWSIGI